jgi:hypothetical protein
MPVLAIGGDHSYGAHLATEVGFAAADVRAAVIKQRPTRVLWANDLLEPVSKFQTAVDPL